MYCVLGKKNQVVQLCQRISKSFLIQLSLFFRHCIGIECGYPIKKSESKLVQKWMR
jgi:hypothetical protein